MEKILTVVYSFLVMAAISFIIFGVLFSQAPKKDPSEPVSDTTIVEINKVNE